MHILILPSFYPLHDGDTSGLFFRDQALALQQHGLQVGVCFVQGRSVRRGISVSGLRDNRFQITEDMECGLPTLRMHGWNPLAQSAPGGYVVGLLHKPLVQRYIARFGRPDLIHAHCVEWAGYGAYLAAREFSIPYVITEHSSTFPERRVSPIKGWFYTRAFTRAAAVVTVSRSLADALHPYRGGRDAQIIPNVVDTEFFTPPGPRPPLEPFEFICVARLANVKGIDVLLRAFAHGFRGDPAVHLTLVGDGPERRVLERLCAELALQAQVTFLGAATPTQVRDVLGRAHAFVLASRVETFAVVLIEALAMGLPLVATRCGGPEDIVTPDTGVLADAGDMEALATAMGQVRREYGRFDRRQLRAAAVRQFSPHAISTRLAALYQEILDARAPVLAGQKVSSL